MRTAIILSTFLMLAILSCNSPDTREHQQPAMPKALEDQGDAYDIIPKRRAAELLESLYSELVSKNADLKLLEDKLDTLDASQNDSAKVFYKFNNKNEAYYNAASRHVEEIKDSVLRDKIKVLVAGSLKKYQSLTAGHNELLKTIDTQSLTLADLHTVLKIVRTLPLIEKYQQDNLPSAKPLKGYINNQNEALKLVDTLAKK